MAISIGDSIPEVTFTVVKGGEFAPATSTEVLGKGKVVLFAVPGAFTPTCSDYHLPGFMVRSDEIFAKGVTTIACISVNDAFVMSAWGKSQDLGEEIVLIADGNGDFAKAIGLELDGSSFGMGLRSQRYAMVIEDGVVQSVDVEPGGGLTVSSAEAILAKI